MLIFLFLYYKECNRSSNFLIYFWIGVEIFSGEFHFMLEMIVAHMNDPEI